MYLFLLGNEGCSGAFILEEFSPGGVLSQHFSPTHIKEQ